MGSYDEETIADFLEVAVQYGQRVKDFYENPNEETASALMVNLDSVKRNIPGGIRDKYPFLKKEQLHNTRLECGSFLDRNEEGEHVLIMHGAEIGQI